MIIVLPLLQVLLLLLTDKIPSIECVLHFRLLRRNLSRHSIFFLKNYKNWIIDDSISLILYDVSLKKQRVDVNLISCSIKIRYNPYVWYCNRYSNHKDKNEGCNNNTTNTQTVLLHLLWLLYKQAIKKWDNFSIW